MTRTRPQRAATALSILALLLAPAAAQERPTAADPSPPVDAAEGADDAASEDIPYETTVAPTGDDRLDEAIRSISQLVRLQDSAPTGAFGLAGRARGDVERVEEALRSEGYYAGRIDIEVAGLPIDTPDLSERIAASEARPVPVEIQVEPGPQYRVTSIALRPAPTATPAEVAALAAIGEPPGLAVGDAARADPVLDAEEAVLDRLREAGHPLASVVDREILVDHDRQAMEVAWTVSPGPEADFARPEVVGQERTNPRLLYRVAERIEGERYSPDRMESARRDLLALGVFDSVRARAADRLDPDGRLPVTFTVSERPRRAVGFTAAYETNFGPAGSVYWEHRNLFGNAERLRVEAEVSRIGAGGGTGDINYRLGASLRRPGLFDGRTSLVLEAAAVRERLEAYDRDAITAGALFERSFTDSLVLSAGPVFEVGRIGRAGNLVPFRLLGLAFGGRYDTTDSPLDATRGVRVAFTATPYADLRDGGSFTRARVTASTYWDVFGDRGSVLAARGTLGSVFGQSRENVTLDKRFYAGGGGSVRGYDYQSIGPRDAQGRPSGGLSLLEGSLEWRQRVRGAFGMVAFVDGGTVGEQEFPDLNDVRFGAGLGLRYATVVGPLRADFAVPLNREGSGSAYGIYLGLGQAF